VYINIEASLTNVALGRLWPSNRLYFTGGLIFDQPRLGITRGVYSNTRRLQYPCRV
jgi:hypothetical protein